VVGSDGRVLGAGHHVRPGGPHAEVAAITAARAAGADPAGATAYVTLEPCGHHGRTPPCVDALLAAGVARVVVGVGDPDPKVAGRGIAALRAAGVVVDVADDAACAASLAPYLHHRRTGRPLVLAKAAASLDGRTAAADGTSRWITGEAARLDVHRLRAQSQAILVGSGTALADRPALTVRRPAGAAVPDRPPIRVVLDRRGRVPEDGPLFDDAAPTWHVTGDGRGLPELLDDLGVAGVLQLLVEGGAAVHGAFLTARLVQRFTLYVAPVWLGPAGRPVVDAAGPGTLADADRWRTLAASRLGNDVRIDYESTW
jgi:diaminohydroxyphosphoribosylaminopyrimidine deaminase/5-amino-6-(5-phosphoribosylamino)uracil reductase